MLRRNPHHTHQTRHIMRIIQRRTRGLTRQPNTARLRPKRKP